MPSPLLLQEAPLQVLRSLAVAIGLNEAIALQQLFYLQSDPANGKVLEDGERYVYNSYPQWRRHFPFWSEVTIKRVFLDLEEGGWIEAKQPNGKDRSKFYRVPLSAQMRLTHERLAEHMEPAEIAQRIKVIPSSDQVDLFMGSNRSDALVITKKTAEKTTNTCRVRNPLFDVLCFVEGSNPSEINGRGGEIARALKSIQEASPAVNTDEIKRRAGNYRLSWPNATLTASALAKHWAKFGTVIQVSKPINSAPAVPFQR